MNANESVIYILKLERSMLSFTNFLVFIFQKLKKVVNK